MTDFGSKRRLLDAACEIARDAGRAILEVYGRADFAVARKSDDSPLTEADQVAHGIISRALAKLDARLADPVGGIAARRSRDAPQNGRATGSSIRSTARRSS